MTKREKPFITVAISDGDSERQLTVRGQYARTLDALVRSGKAGTTALEISSWALRLSHYIFALRKDHNLKIEMVREPHETGHHGRYILHSDVRVIERGTTSSKAEAA